MHRSYPSALAAWRGCGLGAHAALFEMTSSPTRLRERKPGPSREHGPVAFRSMFLCPRRSPLPQDLWAHMVHDKKNVGDESRRGMAKCG